MSNEIIELPFRVSARTARLIGRENVSNADGAIIELVKNCHDADAKDAFILFEGSDLYIVDNGHGMDENTIRNIWMTIGTNNKEIDPFSPNKRVKAGAKGIGRFALDRLGKQVEMFTLPKGSKDGFRWSINWSSFEATASATVGDIKATLQSIDNLDLAKKLPSLIAERKLSFNNGGTILKISQLRDSWDLDALNNLFGNLELLVPIVEKDSFGITLLAKNFPGELGDVSPLINEDFDYRLKAHYNSSTARVTVTIERNELDLTLIKKRYSEVFLEKTMQKSPYTLSEFEAGIFTQEYDIKEILTGFSDDNELLGQIGDITFNLTFAKHEEGGGKEDRIVYPYRSTEYASRSEWLKKFSGVRIFRDNFRVRPYGENGNDWLRLGQRQAASPQGPGQRLGAYKVRPNQIAGSVHISRIYNSVLEDKSSREGIQENDSFDLLKQIILGIIGLLEKDRNVVMFSFRQLHNKTNKREGQKNRGKSAADQVRKAVSDKNSHIEVGVAADLADANEALTSEVKEKDEEIAVLRGLASAGLVTAAVAHELRGMENILATRNSDLKKLISKYIKDDQLADVRDAFNPYVLLSEMEHTDKNLQEWLKYALMPLKRDRRKTKVIYLSEYFKHLSETWSNLLSERKIELNIEHFDNDYSVKMFMIDLDTIFNNLIINSIESFSKRKDKVQRTINISLSDDGKFYAINFKDNGAGLDESFRKNPEDIFLPQKTSKRDATGNVIGTGMGMYLIKNVVEENHGSAEILEDNSGFTLIVKLAKQGI